VGQRRLFGAPGLTRGLLFCLFLRGLLVQAGVIEAFQQGAVGQHVHVRLLADLHGRLLGLESGEPVHAEGKD
jgi:hypothetical protein